MNRFLSTLNVVTLTSAVLQQPSEDSPRKDLYGVECFAWDHDNWVDSDVVEVGVD